MSCPECGSSSWQKWIRSNQRTATKECVECGERYEEKLESKKGSKGDVVGE